jgi:putative endonuclease
MDLHSRSVRPAAHLAGHREGPIEAMSEIPATGNRHWWVYILRCGNGALYTGVTTDVQRRVREHADGGRLSARYTRAFGPVKLAYRCRIGSRELAHRVEYRIKRLRKQKKEELVAGQLTRKALLDWLCITE